MYVIMDCTIAKVVAMDTALFNVIWKQHYLKYEWNQIKYVGVEDWWGAFSVKTTLLVVFCFCIHYNNWN